MTFMLMSSSNQFQSIVMEKIRRLIWCNLVVLHICVKTGLSAKCGNSCCVNFYQISSGSCIECPLGTHGVNCTGKCVRGFYGKLCQSHCDCPAESCNASYGCLKGITEEGKGSINEWVDFTYALIGSVTTVSMSLICLLFFLKSWLSKTNVSSTETNQLCTDQTDNPGEHDNESRSSSSNANEPVLQRTPTHSYTGLRFSRMQPLYDNSKDYESVPEQDTPSVDSLPSHKLRNDDDGESKGDGKYEGLFKNKAYNILSLRIHPLDKAKTLRSVDSSINLWDNMDGMEDEYESIEVKEDNKEECVSERRMVKIHPTGKYVCGEYSTDGTLKDYIGNAQMNKNCDMIVDKEAISQSFIAHELDCTKSFSPRPYSLANSIWRKHHTSEMSKQLRISDYEKVLTLQTGEENFVNDRIFSKTDTQIITESSADPMMSEVSGNNENKNPLKLNKNKAMIFKEAYEKKY